MRQLQNVVVLGLAVSLAFVVGCDSTAMKADKGLTLESKYEAGSVETVSFNMSNSYRQWVEMANQKADQQAVSSMKVVTEELVMQRQIESVEKDGSAIMNVTIDSAKLHVHIKRQKKETDWDYSSTAAGTKTSGSSSPKLAGASYKIKIAPDTTVLEIIGLDELRSKLGIGDDAGGAIVNILSEDHIKLCHERQSLINAKKTNATGEKLLPVTNVMVKAKAIQKSYFSGDVEQVDGKDVVRVSMLGTALYVLPEGTPDDFPKPKDPPDLRMVIKEKSEMDPFVCDGEAVFDVAAGKVISETDNMKAVLVLPSSALFPAKSKKKPGDKDDVMYTEVAENYSFKCIK